MYDIFKYTLFLTTKLCYYEKKLCGKEPPALFTYKENTVQKIHVLSFPCFFIPFFC